MKVREQYFEKLKAEGTENVFAGELYLAWHRGTYTAQAKTKLGVRRAECVLKEAEYWNCVTAVRTDDKSAEKKAALERAELLKKLWKRLLFQEFHDILPGTGIARVHEEAQKELAEIAEQGEADLNECLGCLEELEKNQTGERQECRERNAGQAQTESALVRTCGQEAVLKPEMFFWKAAFYMRRLMKPGSVVKLELKKDRKTEKSLGKKEKPMNEFRLYRNVNSYYDAWEIGMYEEEEEPIDRSGWCISPEVYEDRPAWRLDGHRLPIQLFRSGYVWVETGKCWSFTPG